jgi:hypothetical protein
MMAESQPQMGVTVEIRDERHLFPVSSRVNHVANDDEECSRPAVIADPQNHLFA